MVSFLTEMFTTRDMGFTLKNTFFIELKVFGIVIWYPRCNDVGGWSSEKKNTF
jgi:hypothetical protein